MKRIFNYLRARRKAGWLLWLMGFLTGLASATFSTLFISLGARRIGRDRATDWMEVGTVYFLLHRQLRGEDAGSDGAFGRKSLFFLGGALGGLGALALARRLRGEWPPLLVRGSRREAARTFLRHMTWHHEVGVRLARAAVQKATGHDLLVLSRLMLAERRAEIDVMRGWWASWFKEPMAPLTADEYAAMAGMPPPAELDALEQRPSANFDRRFIDVMVFHHQGAIKMADDVWRKKSDPRVLLLADSIRHAQAGQIERMRALRDQ